MLPYIYGYAITKVDKIHDYFKVLPFIISYAPIDDNVVFVYD